VSRHDHHQPCLGAPRNKINKMANMIDKRMISWISTKVTDGGVECALTSDCYEVAWGVTAHSRITDSDDDLGAGVLHFQVADRVRRFAQWVGPVDDRGDLAGFDQLC
jgi:hypothetical protein